MSVHIGQVLKELENSLLEFDALEHMLRAFILKIQVSDSLLSQLPEGKFFFFSSSFLHLPFLYYFSLHRQHSHSSFAPLQNTHVLGRAGCRFELLAYSWSRPDSSANNTVWVDEDPSGERVQIKDPKIVPIKSINNCNISLQLYAEM